MEELHFKGHFHLDCLDKDNNILSSIDDPNLIVTTARKSMAEIFANLEGIKFAHKLVLGTQGCVDGMPFVPKDETSGLDKAREHLFSEVVGETYQIGDVVEKLLTYDLIKVHDSESDSDIIYRYNGKNADNYIISAENISVDFTKYDTAPYTYELNFHLPRTNTFGEDESFADGTTDVAQVVQTDTSVTFTFIISMENGNNQHVNEPGYTVPTTLFNEAGLYVNDRLFSIKTFSSRVKDESIKLRIIWTITF